MNSDFITQPIYIEKNYGFFSSSPFLAPRSRFIYVCLWICVYLEVVFAKCWFMSSHSSLSPDAIPSELKLRERKSLGGKNQPNSCQVSYLRTQTTTGKWNEETCSIIWQRYGKRERFTMVKIRERKKTHSTRSQQHHVIFHL